MSSVNDQYMRPPSRADQQLNATLRNIGQGTPTQRLIRLENALPHLIWKIRSLEQELARKENQQ